MGKALSCTAQALPEVQLWKQWVLQQEPSHKHLASLPRDKIGNTDLERQLEFICKEQLTVIKCKGKERHYGKVKGRAVIHLCFLVPGDPIVVW